MEAFFREELPQLSKAQSRCIFRSWTRSLTQTEGQDSVSNALDNNINTKSNGNSFFWKKDASKYIGKIVWIVELLPPTSTAGQHTEQQ